MKSPDLVVQFLEDTIVLCSDYLIQSLRNPGRSPYWSLEREVNVTIWRSSFFSQSESHAYGILPDRNVQRKKSSREMFCFSFVAAMKRLKMEELECAKNGTDAIKGCRV